MAEAARRPKDFAGLERGWFDSRPHRELMYASGLHYGGPALLSGGVWTAVAICRLPGHRLSP
eukprot:11429683-Alexandrium_andersonii.AAC.1